MNKPIVAIVDYGMGNLCSITRACEYVGLTPVISSDKSVISSSDALILPGVGAFGEAMNKIMQLDLEGPMKGFIESGRYFMGICLGMQLLMTESDEFGHHKGLDIIRGGVVKFPVADKENRIIKVPQVGWNRIYAPPGAGENLWDNSPLKGITAGAYMYFVHSYYTVPEDPDVVLSCTTYEGTEYASTLLKKNVLACQFHPEKSASDGLKIYKNWSEMISATTSEDRKR